MSLSDNYLYEFGEYRLNVTEKLLISGETRISLTPKVFEMLSVFLESDGKLVSKDDLMDKVWANSFVEESNLTFTIRQLRKVLNDDARLPKYIETVPRRGYRFIAEVKKSAVPVLVEKPEIPAEKDEIKPIVNENYNTKVDDKVFPNQLNVYQIIKYRPLLFTLSAIAVSAFVLLFWANVSWTKPASKNLLNTSFDSENLTATGNTQNAAISPDGNLVCYTSRVGGQDSLWLRQLKTNTNLQILAPGEEIIRRVDFSADGQSIFIIKGKRGNPSSLYNLAIIGGLPNKIVSGIENVLGVSFDGKKIAFVKMNEPDKTWLLIVADTDGSNERIIFTKPIAEPIWAVAFSQTDDSVISAFGQTGTGQAAISISEISLSSGETKDLSAKKWFQIKDLARLPDNDGLILAGRERLSDQNALWLLSKNGEAKKISSDTNYFTEFSLTADAKNLVGIRSTPNFNLWLTEANKPAVEAHKIAEGYRGVSWSPDNKIAYASSINGNEDIWRMNADGGAQKQLTFTDSTEFLPRFSSDGKQIVFVSSQSEKLHIWIMNADGGEIRQLTDDGGELSPSLTRDGKWLVFHTPSDEKVWKMPLENSGKPILITEEHALRSEVSPDGKSIVFLHPSNRISADSSIFVASFETGEKLREFKIAGTNLSAWRFHWSDDGKGFYYAAYQNSTTANIYFQSLADDEVKKITNFNDLQIFDFDFSPDLEKIAIIRGSWNQDAVLIKTLQ
jgi:Tol biopolymer transport system component/DNA-binding winged helix-turn-helix (wHTH) protein